MTPTLSYASRALSSTWRINVAGRIYGPYTGHQLKEFVTEGRIVPHSIVQAGDVGPWITAIDDPVLAQLFIQDGPSRASNFEHRKSSQPAKAQVSTTGERALRHEKQAPSNLLIFADLRTGNTEEIELALGRFGQSCRLSPHVWLLNSTATASGVRNVLADSIGKSDSLLVVDASHDKLAWSNFGPETDAKIRQVWKASQATML